MFFSSGIGPEDAEGKRSPDIHKQIQQTFRNLKTLLEAAGFTYDDVAQVTVYMAHPEHSGHREILNKYWLEVFPDPSDRPVRKALKGSWENDQLVQFQVIAVLS